MKNEKAEKNLVSIIRMMNTRTKARPIHKICLPKRWDRSKIRTTSSSDAAEYILSQPKKTSTKYKKMVSQSRFAMVFSLLKISVLI